MTSDPLDTMDVCPACRIQAPHRDGRLGCPQCGGPLTQTGRAMAPSVPQPALQEPVLVRRPTMRWIATRPREAIPAPMPARAIPAGPTPAYRYVPRWGLHDEPARDEAVGAADPAVEVTFATYALQRSLWLTALTFAAAAVVHAIRYTIVAVNRSQPIPAWIDWLSSIAVLVFGVMTLISVVLVFVSFARWTRRIRERDYASAGFIDPRRPWLVVAASVVPLMNVFTAPWMLYESARVANGEPGDAAVADRVRQRLAVAFALVNVMALAAFGYRALAIGTESVQIDADALMMVTASFVLSAVFAYWSIARFGTLGGVRESVSGQGRRLVRA